MTDLPIAAPLAAALALYWPDRPGTPTLKIPRAAWVLALAGALLAVCGKGFSSYWPSDRDMRALHVDPDEPYAANGLLVGGRLIYPESFPRTRARLEAAGIAIDPVDVSELQKAEGAVTCCSLVFSA